MAGRTDLVGKRERRGAAAATDIDDAFPCAGACPIDQNLGDRRKHDILGLLPVGPVLTARPVPVGDLFGVPIVAGRRGHGMVLTDVTSC